MAKKSKKKRTKKASTNAQQQASQQAPIQPQAPAQQAPQPQQPATMAQQPIAPPESSWQAAQANGFVDQPMQPAPLPHVDAVRWTSAEYMSHTKTSIWYVLFTVGTLGITALIYLFTKEILASLAILIVGASAGFFSARPPASRNYEINDHELKIDDRVFPLESFKSFSIVEEGAKDSIWLKPTKRFAPFQIIYFNAEDEDRIINILSILLPHEERELDHLDLLTKKLKF